MVQYVFTPWRDRQELLTVRRQLYPQHHGLGDGTVDSSRNDNADARTNQGECTTLIDEQHDAVARVSMWMQRGNCPHLVESTALLKAAILGDLLAARAADSAAARSSGSYAARAAYSAAFSRYVCEPMSENSSPFVLVLFGNSV